MVEIQNPELSIIILNYNVKELLLKCLESIFQSKGTLDKWQVIVVDNASTDGSAEAVKEKYLRSHPLRSRSEASLTSGKLELVENKSNLGFAAGNNVGVKLAQAPVVLFLNPDTVVIDHAIQKSLEILLSNPDFGALTCRVELPNGKLDYSCHRGFPTPWNSFCYFAGLSKMFPHSSFFSGYTASYLDINRPHEVDCVTGAFLMVRKAAGEQIGWWNEDYFWNGEDIEFCYSLKAKGWKIYFYPEVKIIHYKGSSSGLWKTALVKVDQEKKLQTVSYGVSAMRIFYKKHYYPKYPPLFRDSLLWALMALEQYRKLKVRTGSPI